jgi:tetratricopeptide (TPR) repeat protein
MFFAMLREMLHHRDKREGMRTKLLYLVFLLLFPIISVRAQETVFALLKRDQKLADQYFAERNYRGALMLYDDVAKKKPSEGELQLKIARCFYFLKQYSKAAEAYNQCAVKGYKFTNDDIYYRAETEACLTSYDQAIQHYRDYLSNVSDDHIVMRKVWQLSNIKFLYEDSANYAVSVVPVNSAYGELCPSFYKNGLVFVSNRKEVMPVEKIDAALNTQCYRLYFVPRNADSLQFPVTFNYGKPEFFAQDVQSGLHNGPLVFYDNFKRMVITSTSSEAQNNRRRTLQLSFARYDGTRWRVTDTFPHNSELYSISDPAISSDGTVLYFCSDMPGGFGKKDIYRSQFHNGQWSAPVNLGEQINTSQDEAYPYLYKDNTLYFSSNGHAGLGGLDIFKTAITQDGFGEVENLGYPINSNRDDFGVIIDSLHQHGFFTSNRGKEGLNDDLYEFDIDVQHYPLTISGVIEIREQNWNDSIALRVFPNAKLHLIDNIRNVTVAESASDAAGNFSIQVPYFTKYKIKITGSDLHEHIVSLEIPRQRKLLGSYHIVVVQDAFRSSQNKELK